ncbi:MAG: Smr/MutS family protein [Thermoanaerobaculia bacterium]|nr:Smr/MutS family protein [Thermoanaerobaculia bacterium]
MNDDWNPEEDPIEIPIEDTIDLHPFRAKEIRDVVREYLAAARDEGFRQVRLIHGKGKGVQRRSIRALLDTIEWVKGYEDGGLGGGEWGATVVFLEEERTTGTSEEEAENGEDRE